MNTSLISKVTFIGHRTISYSLELEETLKEYVSSLILKGAKTFLFGSKSEFDTLALKVVSELKKEYPFIKRVYVRAEYPNLSGIYEKLVMKNYDHTIYPDCVKEAGRACYIERNKYMIDHSDLVIFYYKENYQLPKKQIGNRYYSRTSGTDLMVQYAKSKNKKYIVINKKDRQ